MNPDARVLERAAEFSKLFAYHREQIAEDDNFDALVEKEREKLRVKIEQYQEWRTEAEASGRPEEAAMWGDFIKQDTEFAEKHPRKRLPKGYERWVAVERILAECHLRQMTIDIHCEEATNKEAHQAVIGKTEGRHCACGYMGYTVPI